MHAFEPLASWNGTIAPLASVKIDVLDRGFLFGDGVYEVIGLYQGRPFLIEEHLTRLNRSLSELRIRFDVSTTAARLKTLLEKTPQQDGYVYIQITRGTAMRNHLFPKNCQPNELIYVLLQPDPLAAFRQRGIAVIVAQDIRWHRPDIKSINLLPNVLIRQKAADAKAQEAILVRGNGRVTEATSSNVFITRNQVVITPKSDQWILEGISRKFVTTLCEKHGIEWREEEICKADLWRSDEIFLSSTFSEVIAVTQLEGHPVGNGSPGPISKRLAEYFRQEIDLWLQS